MGETMFNLAFIFGSKTLKNILQPNLLTINYLFT